MPIHRARPPRSRSWDTPCFEQNISSCKAICLIQGTRPVFMLKRRKAISQSCKNSFMQSTAVKLIFQKRVKVPAREYALFLIFKALMEMLTVGYVRCLSRKVRTWNLYIWDILIQSTWHLYVLEAHYNSSTTSVLVGLEFVQLSMEQMNLASKQVHL